MGLGTLPVTFQVVVIEVIASVDTPAPRARVEWRARLVVDPHERMGACDVDSGGWWEWGCGEWPHWPGRRLNVHLHYPPSDGARHLRCVSINPKLVDGLDRHRTIWEAKFTESGGAPAVVGELVLSGVGTCPFLPGWTYGLTATVCDDASAD